MLAGSTEYLSDGEDSFNRNENKIRSFFGETLDKMKFVANQKFPRHNLEINKLKFQKKLNLQDIHEEISACSEKTSNEMKKKIRKEIKPTYYRFKKVQKTVVFQGTSEYIMTGIRRCLAQSHSDYKIHQNRSQKKLYRLNLNKKLVLMGKQSKITKFDKLKRVYPTQLRFMRPDKIIKFYDCLFPLNYKYLKPSELRFGYKPFSRIRYLKKVECISKDHINNIYFVLLSNKNVYKLSPYEEGFQLNLLNVWLEHIDSPDSHRLANTIKSLKDPSFSLGNFSFIIQSSAPKAVKYIKQLNRTTVRNIRKFPNFSLVFATDLNKEFNLDLKQIELNQEICKLANINLDCQSENYDIIYDFLDKFNTMNWIEYFYTYLQSYLQNTEQNKSFKLQQPECQLDNDFLYQYNEQTLVSNHFSCIYLEKFVQNNTIFFKFIHVLKKKKVKYILT